MYKEEKEIIECGLQQNYDYFLKRKKWHDLPIFDQLVPRPSCDAHINPIDENLLEQTCVFTGGDKNCYTLLVQFLESFFATRIASKIDMYVFDAGLTDPQLHYIAKHFPIKKVVQPTWPFDDTVSPSYCITFMAKIFLPGYCKDYRYYYWCDADIWIQDENYFLDYLRHASVYQIGISALTGHDGYGYVFGSQCQTLTKQYRDTLFYKTYFNSGIYCIDKKSGLFEKIQKNAHKLFQVEQKRIPLFDEMCLNYTIHKNKFHRNYLAQKHNYLMCDDSRQYAIPLSENNVLYSPYDLEAIGLIHLTWRSKSFYFYPTQKNDITGDQLMEHRRVFVFHHLMFRCKDENKTMEELYVKEDQIIASMHYRIWPD